MANLLEKQMNKDPEWGPPEPDGARLHRLGRSFFTHMEPKKNSDLVEFGAAKKFALYVLHVYSARETRNGKPS